MATSLQTLSPCWPWSQPQPPLTKGSLKSEPIVKIPVQDSFQKCFGDYWRGNPESSVSVSLATKSVKLLKDVGRNRKEGQISAGSHVPFFSVSSPSLPHCLFIRWKCCAIIWRCYLWHCQQHDHQPLTVKAEEADFWVQENTAASLPMRCRPKLICIGGLEANVEKMTVNQVSEVLR